MSTITLPKTKKTSNLQIRLDPELKSEVEFILSQLGLNTAQAVAIFFKQIIRQKAIPFALSLDSIDWQNVENSRKDYKKGKFVALNSSEDIDNFVNNPETFYSQNKSK